MKTIVVIPAYNEETTVAQAVNSAKSFCDEVLVINDGSCDRTAELARAAGATVLTHIINRRYTLGAALRTGIAGALQKGADIIVTFDADLQHEASDIPRMKEPIEKSKADVVIGSRFLNHAALSTHHTSFHRRVGGMVANILTLLLYGIHSTDSQSGLRAFSRMAAYQLHLKSNRMEVSSEIIGEVAHNNLRIQEIAIQPIYSKYALSKGQNFFLGLKTAFQLIRRRLLR